MVIETWIPFHSPVVQDQDLQTLSHLNEVQIVLDFHFVNNIDFVKTRRVQLKKKVGGQRGPSHLHNKTKFQTIKEVQL